MLGHLISLKTFAILAVVAGEFLLSPRPLSPLVALEIKPRSLVVECRALLLVASACLGLAAYGGDRGWKLSAGSAEDSVGGYVFF